MESKSLDAAEAMKLTAKDLLNFGIIDEIIPEPIGGAHRDPEAIALDIKHSIVKNLRSFENLSKEEIYDQRKSRFLKIGREQGFSSPSDVSDEGLIYRVPNFQKSSHILKKIIYLGLSLNCRFNIDNLLNNCCK